MAFRLFSRMSVALATLFSTVFMSAPANATVFSCRDAATGATLFMYGQVEPAAYQMNEKLAAALRKKGARSIEVSGLGRFGPPDSTAFLTTFRKGFAFRLSHQLGSPETFRLKVYNDLLSNESIPHPQMRPVAVFDFQTRHCSSK